MKEQIHTIPVNDAFDAGDECPFCFLERKAEQHTIRYVAGPGASYMEPEVRGATDEAGFCRVHMKKLYDYGNALGNALMLQTHFAGVLEDLKSQIENMDPPAKKGLFGKKKKDPSEEEPYWKKLRRVTDDCYICNRIDYNMERYLQTFFMMIKDAQFREKVEGSKGFCLRHFSMLLEMAEDKLPGSQHEWFYATVYRLMQENLLRVKEDLDWFVGMYDYRSAGRDWKNSRDAVARTMQKLEGLYPEDPIYRSDDS